LSFAVITLAMVACKHSAGSATLRSADTSDLASCSAGDESGYLMLGLTGGSTTAPEIQGTLREVSYEDQETSEVDTYTFRAAAGGNSYRDAAKSATLTFKRDADGRLVGADFAAASYGNGKTFALKCSVVGGAR